MNGCVRGLRRVNGHGDFHHVGTQICQRDLLRTQGRTLEAAFHDGLLGYPKLAPLLLRRWKMLWRSGTDHSQNLPGPLPGRTHMRKLHLFSTWILQKQLGQLTMLYSRKTYGRNRRSDLSCCSIFHKKVPQRQRINSSKESRINFLM